VVEFAAFFCGFVMEKFTVLVAAAAPLDRGDVDTDQIIPKQFLRSVARSGFGDNLFDEWRYLDRGEIGMDNAARPRDPDFVLNDPRYRQARILLARDNFGCGSSREHAVWALCDYGFRAVIAPSFGDIFRGNAANNGLLAAVAPLSAVDRLFDEARIAPDGLLRVDLPAQTITSPSGEVFAFEISASDKRRLQSGEDDIDATLARAADIRRYEERRQVSEPWIFD
jgi:3-isopropylmalate/(R)-2-methylmalate dehydratase small subunit